MNAAFLRRLAVYVVSAAFLWFMAAKTHNPFLYALFFASLVSGGLGLVFVILSYARGGVEVRRFIPHQLEEDEELLEVLILKNRRRLPLLNVFIEEELPCALPSQRLQRAGVEYLGGRQEARLAIRCRCPQRGYYRFEEVRVLFCDPFGFFQLQKRIELFSELYVYPRLFSVRSFPELKKGALPWFGIDTTHVSGDDDEFFGIREYQDGEFVQKIHWFSTARKSRLIVKQFQRNSFVKATILFALEPEKNYGEGKEAVAEYMVKIAASVADYLLKRNVSVEVISFSGQALRIPFGKGAEQAERMFAFFALAQPSPGTGVGELLNGYITELSEGSNLIVILLDEDWGELMQVLPLYQQNICVVPLLLSASSFKYALSDQAVVADAKRKLAHQLNARTYLFSRGEDLAEVFSSL